MKCRLAAALALVSAMTVGCKSDAAPPAPAPPPIATPIPATPTPTPAPTQAPAQTPTTAPAPAVAAVSPLAELSFVPATAEAIVHVDLAALSSRSPDAARTLDFVLHAQHPRIHAVLASAGITIGKDIHAVTLFAGHGDAYVVAGVGDLDAARLDAALRRTNPVVQRAATGSLFTWKKATPGAAESPGPGEDVAVGVDAGIVLAGTPALVRQALLCRAGKAPGLAAGPLAAEVARAQTSATAWGVAAPRPGATLAAAVPGLQRARFSGDIAAPGPDIDGILDLRAEFGTAAEAEAFRGRLDAFLSTFAAVGGKSSLGAALGRLRSAAKLRMVDDGRTLIAQSAL
jgi:hypothetical protein